MNTNTRMNPIGLKVAATLAVIIFVLGSAPAQSPSGKLTDNRFDNRSGFRFDLFPFRAKRQGLSLRYAGFSLMPARAMTPLAAGPNVTVFGSGTLGRLTKWAGFTSSNSTIADSTIFEDKFGMVGIGTDSPTSKLTVSGMIQTTLGGLKFPDGTIQTTAGLFSVFHNTTLTGNGMQASPVGVAVPLTLEGDGSAILHAVNLGSGIGVDGFAVLNSGVRGISTNGVGVDGRSENSHGLSGFSTNGNGLRAHSINAGGVIATSDTSIGVFAQGGISDNDIAPEGLQAKGGRTFTKGGAGVLADGAGNVEQAGDGVVATGGKALGNSPQTRAGNGVVAIGGDNPRAPGHGVIAKGGHVGGAGVSARGSDETTGNAPGGDGVRTGGGTGSGANQSSGNGITAIAGFGANGASDGLAGHFIGKVFIDDDLDVQGTKNFKIDHPLDPENKYLYHAAIESSEVLNVYSGNVKTNEEGETTVTLPDWFEALNRDFRYQLTVVGTFAQAIVADEIRNNRFKIRTSAPGVKVSWQVTGVRSDAVMLKHPFRTEEEKPVRERGTYLSPEAYGQPEERSVEWAQNPEMMRQLKERRGQMAQKTQGNNP